MTPEQRAMRARIAAHTRWSQEADPQAATAPARRASLARFEREVDPEGTLPHAERARRAEHALRAYMQKLALKSSQARRKRATPPAR